MLDAVVEREDTAGGLSIPGQGVGGTDQHGELAVVEGAQRAEQPTAGRDLFLLYARSAAWSGRESLTKAPWRGGQSLAVELP